MISSKTLVRICTGLLLFFSLLAGDAGAQTRMTGYDSAWKKIDRLILEKVSNKSALSEVNKIYEKAKKEKNEAQLIEGLVIPVKPGTKP